MPWERNKACYSLSEPWNRCRLLVRTTKSFVYQIWGRRQERNLDVNRSWFSVSADRTSHIAVVLVLAAAKWKFSLCHEEVAHEEITFCLPKPLFYYLAPLQIIILYHKDFLKTICCLFVLKASPKSWKICCIVKNMFGFEMFRLKSGRS